MIATGTHLGSYEVVSQIGAGGMGEVYKAHDTKLGRNVAIKVLPEQFARDPERLARFQREAKMLAALNHPNIATIHGLEHSNSTHYLVMELVAGDTLAERIKKDGPVPVEEALKISVQIAEALEAAHEKEIMHRDLKPANVKVTPEGKVKVLDFGLAKAFAGDVADSNPSQSPTLSAVATMQGVLLGTAWLDRTGKKQPLLAKPGNYLHPRLSPDGQRLGLLVSDGSSQDLWSYEWQRDTMTRLTFGGTGANPMAVWTPDGRYVVFEVAGGISWTRADGGGQPHPLTQSKNRQQPWSFALDAKRLAYVETNPSTGHFDLWTLPVETGTAGLRAGNPEVFLKNQFDPRHPSFSPDGKWLAYSSNESGGYEIYVRAFPDNGGKWQISNTGGMYPTWSPNGHELFFRTEDSRMILVASYAVKGDAFVADKPRIWSETMLADAGLNQNFDLAPDGKRIAALMPAQNAGVQAAQNQVIFLENFFDELRRRVPSGK